MNWTQHERSCNNPLSLWRPASPVERISKGYRPPVVHATEYYHRQNEGIVEQEQALQAMTTLLEERERMVADLWELNDMNRLLITRYQEYEDREAEVDDEENSRSSRERC